MLTLKKPSPDIVLRAAAWFLAGLLFALICATAFYEARAAEDEDAGLTRSEICKKQCEREHTRGLDSSGARMESYGEPRQFVGSEAACNKDLGDCLRHCALAPSPIKDMPREPAGSGTQP